MKRLSKYSLLFCIFMILHLSSNSWGFFGHKKINRMAVFCLPPEMISFYKFHIEYISEHAVDPDKRRYAIENEAERHYIDIDHFAKEGENVFEIMPKEWKEACLKYSEDSLRKYGIVPWHIKSMMHWLTKAFEKGDVESILSLSADLGHYVADAHVPLHTTENYNGQLSGQKGIHAFWESRLPELKANEYDLMVGRAEYIHRSLDFIWSAVEQSHLLVDSVLFKEKWLNDKFPKDQKYAFVSRGNSTVRQFSEAYSHEYHRSLNGMVEQRMRKSIIAVGSIWYTAWVNAGQPDLDKLLEKSKLLNFKKEDKDLNTDTTVNIKGRHHHVDE